MATGQLKVKTPELDKMLAVKDKSQIIGSFIEEIREKGLYLCEVKEGRDVQVYDVDGDRLDEEYVPVRSTIEKLLADYFAIDLDKCEEERRAILDSIRN